MQKLIAIQKYDGRTDRPTNAARCRVACPRPKREVKRLCLSVNPERRKLIFYILNYLQTEPFLLITLNFLSRSFSCFFIQFCFCVFLLFLFLFLLFLFLLYLPFFSSPFSISILFSFCLYIFFVFFILFFITGALPGPPRSRTSHPRWG